MKTTENERLLQLHTIIYDQIKIMIEEALKNGKHQIDGIDHYSIDVKTFDRLVCAVKGIPYTGDKNVRT